MFILDRIDRELHSLERLELKFDSSLEFFHKIPVRILLRISIIIISNGNRSEWSPIRSLMIRVINKILNTSMTTDRIGQHEVLLPINHNLTKFVIYKALFLNQNTRNSKILFC